MRGNSPVRFGKRPTEKDPNHGHLAGGLFHSEGAPAFARSSAKLKGLRQELRDVWACLRACVLGFVVNPGGVVRWG
jgi:hypothetical protein